jgi:hypothetical protein
MGVTSSERGTEHSCSINDKKNQLTSSENTTLAKISLFYTVSYLRGSDMCVPFCKATRFTRV